MFSVIRLLQQGWKGSEGQEIAAPFDPDQLHFSALNPAVSSTGWRAFTGGLERPLEGLPGPLYLAGASTSSLDLAHELVKADLLPEWGSILVLTQSQGRGQLRRNWISPEGNIYAALRLPAEGVFNSEAAALAVGALLAEALEKAAYPVSLKWPNDLLQPDRSTGYGRWNKIGGILLEERGPALIAGIGLNLVSAPASTQLREDHAFPASFLHSASSCKIVAESRFEGASPLFSLWCLLVEQIFFCYEQHISASAAHLTDQEWWFDAVNARLAFRQTPVRLVNALPENGREGEASVEGRMEGIDANGALCLVTARGREKFVGGSLMPAYIEDLKG